MQQGFGMRLADVAKGHIGSPLIPLVSTLYDGYWEMFTRTLGKTGSYDPSAEIASIPTVMLDITAHFMAQTEALRTLTDTPIEAMFITPADLLNHSTNLKKVDEFRIRWE